MIGSLANTDPPTRAPTRDTTDYWMTFDRHESPDRFEGRRREHMRVLLTMSVMFTCW
jgi:hypothetical protein